MPLTKRGKQILKEWQKRYKSKGKSFFYAYMRKFPEETETWEKR